VNSLNEILFFKILLLILKNALILFPSLKWYFAGNVIISQKLEYGSRQISISVPESGINEIRNIKVENSNKYCFITLGDNAGKPDYKHGDIKLSVSLLDKLPF